jgi:uncharacterized protein YbcI
MSEVRQTITGEALAEVTRRLVQLHKEYYGKGPTRAKAYLVNDTVLCLLEGGFTMVERTLIEHGEADSVRNMRRSFQVAMEHEFTQTIEDALGRRVIAYMSQVHSNPDISAELFVMEALGDIGANGDVEALALEHAVVPEPA